MTNNNLKNCKREKVLMFVAGGTGGHIYPSLSLISKMKNYNFLIFTDNRGFLYYENFFDKKNINYKIFTNKVTSPSNKNIVNKIISLFQLFISLVKSLLILTTQKPDIAIGFGGYPTVAPMLAAKFFSTPLIIHEQNAIIGRGNKLLSKISNKLALSFENTKKIENVKNSIFTGNPVREEFEQIGNNHINELNLNKFFTILIYGGSLGASYFSRELTSAICSLPTEIKTNIKIIQQVRIEDLENVKNNYKSHKVEAEISTFFQNIYKKFQIADLIITRSGGSSVAEILASCKPAIFVPLPSSFENHQYENAKFFEINNCGWIFDQIKNSENDLQKLIKDIIESLTKIPHNGVKVASRASLERLELLFTS
ncbi:MAG: UDP-N-acetylglucosamine--N-acetylmuramyl-(pentapeptide) pyrophosphoryl-undecaprenol N-acetylglucosamine transferase [Gammaproteobacteria bacterium]|nr:UDP-N-acetylglucosamine--N-acetylmuramyl-(pentapeptide) pyrophosphoryl-undecaprenol N-acetylglucosamine transferase [Gammaproteobacteria bacterium]